MTDAKSPDRPLDVAGVSVSYGDKHVLQNLSLQIEPGEVFGLVGLNGVGKTTLIRSILSLRAAKGDIRIFGLPSSLPAARRNLVYLPEKFQPSVHLSGWEYLSILLAYFGQKVNRPQVLEIAKGLDLDPEAIGRRIKTYSKGMGQKLGLVGTLLVDASLMILDEPMSGLDPRARALLKDRLKESRARGRAIFFSSHILADIEEICDRIGILHGGRIVFLGAPQKLIERYRAPSLERAFLAALEDNEKNVAAYWSGASA